MNMPSWWPWVSRARLRKEVHFYADWVCELQDLSADASAGRTMLLRIIKKLIEQEN